MLSQRLQLPVFIGRNRAQILREAENQTQGRVFLLDDAFQNLSFRHDTDLVAIHTDRSLEDAFCLPLGDLRESFSALHFASALLLVEGTYLQAWEKFLAERFPFLPCFLARVQVDGVWGAEGPMATGGNLSWGAFCAIARPERFCRSLAPFSPLFFQAFPDHYAFTQKDADTILEKKNQTGAHLLITTEKDWHKAVPFFQGRSVPLYYLRIGYVFSKEFWYFLKSRLETV
jgi:tetraacyldisaccharide 4'-kinase